MYEALDKEIALYEKRTPKSAAAHKRALERIPLGVASNYRHYEPYPIFVKDGKGSKIHDIDGNEYIDHNLCFGALMAGHCHPAVVKAVEQKLHEGTTFGMPHEQEWELAEEICKRYPVEMVRFGSSGTEVTMHACRIARAATGRDKILKFEGAYHGLHDTALVSVKPKAEDYGDPDAPKFEEWIYGQIPQTVRFVRFRGDRVVMVKICALGKPVEIHSEDEMDGYKAPPNTREIAMGDAQPGDNSHASPPPTLRKPGEPVPADQANKVRFPDDPDAKTKVQPIPPPPSQSSPGMPNNLRASGPPVSLNPQD